MIEDPDLTLKILKHFARDDVGYPAHVSPNDLVKEFPGESRSRINYHVMCAIDCEFLRGKYDRVAAARGVAYTFGFIDGLTKAGGDYVRNSETRLWDEAKKTIIEKGLAITTTHLITFMQNRANWLLG